MSRWSHEMWIIWFCVKCFSSFSFQKPMKFIYVAKELTSEFVSHKKVFCLLPMWSFLLTYVSTVTNYFLIMWTLVTSAYTSMFNIVFLLLRYLGFWFLTVVVNFLMTPNTNNKITHHNNMTSSLFPSLFDYLADFEC